MEKPDDHRSGKRKKDIFGEVGFGDIKEKSLINDAVIEVEKEKILIP
jgi:hypothetical protein